ncbi:MAG TPA: TlpA disulfide reductase family protein [Actinomycetota bacterium]|jgi:thiol-disulfide isomerase/thioredoxin|nr:TlpA disulfide reductase family protein [Actinomycetota bacterium]
MLGYALAGIAVAVVVVLVILAMLPAGNSEASAVRPAGPGQVHTSASPRSSMLAKGDVVPSFSAPGFHMEATDGSGYVIKGERIGWSSYQGVPVVLVIWAPWCPHCQAELPRLAEVAKDYPNVRLLTVVSAIGQEPGPTPNAYLAQHGLTFPVALDDAEGTLLRILGIQGFPTLYFVNSDGTVAQASTGEIDESSLRLMMGNLS